MMVKRMRMQTTLVVHDHEDGGEDPGVAWAVTSMTMIGFLAMDSNYGPCYHFHRHHS